MKTIYQDKEFADYWNKRAGDKGEDYKRFILDPLLFDLVGDLSDKTIMELGCGNGYLAKQILDKNPKKVIMADISKFNIKNAKEKITNNKVKFKNFDATQKWPLDNNSLDVILSNMVLNEVESINALFKESYRVLTKGGKFGFSTLHPAYYLYYFVLNEAEIKTGKFINLGGYFSGNHCKYLMGKVSATKMAEKQKIETNYEVGEVQKTVEDYFKSLKKVGFTIDQLLEPQLTKELLDYNPKFRKYLDAPIALVFLATK